LSLPFLANQRRRNLMLKGFKYQLVPEEIGFADRKAADKYIELPWL